MKLDPRLQKVFDLYPTCALGADIGADHGYLALALLGTGKVSHMVVTDISPDALANAHRHIDPSPYQKRTTLRLASGLSGVQERVDCISITGMGGKLIETILLEGRDRLRGASLILSAHTDLPLVRQAVMDVGYTITHEEVALAQGRYYLIFKAQEGESHLSQEAIALGTAHLLEDNQPLKKEYLKRRLSILSQHLQGLEEAKNRDEASIRQIRGWIATLQRSINL